MRGVMHRFAKGDGIEGATNQGCFSWEEGTTNTGQVLEIQDEQVPTSLVVDLEVRWGTLST